MRSPFSIVNSFRLFYFIQFFGIGTFMSFIALYLSSIGFSGGQVGLLLALNPLIGFLVQPLWGILSDVNHIHKQVLVFACFGVTIAMIGFALTENFVSLIFITIFHAVMRAPIGLIGTALALEFLERDNSKDAFGSLRLWGSIGFAIAVFGIGAFLIEDAIWWIIPIYAVCNLLLGLVALTIPKAEVHGEVLWQEGFSLLFRNRVLSYFLFGTFLVSITLGVVNSYLAVYLVDISGAGWVIGVALAISALTEVPLMSNVPAIIKRWGIRLALVAGIAALPIRWLLYVFIDEPLLVLPTQVLHSIAMTSMLVIAVLYVDRLLAPKWRASGQSLYMAAMSGIGPSIGLYAAGIIYERSGIDLVWLLCAIVAAAGTFVIGLVVYRNPAKPQIQKAMS